jgi:hypothetical protein
MPYCVDHADRLAEALGLVVAGARAGARDEAAVVFRGRDRVGRWVAVDLAGRVEQEALHRPAALLLLDAVVQQVAQAVDVGVDRLQRVLAVVRRRCNAGGVDDPVEVRHVGRQRLDQVVALHREVRRAFQRGQPLRLAADEVVPHRHLDRAGPGLVEVQRGEHQVVAQEAGPAGDQQALTRHAAELLLQLAADVVEVRAQELLEAGNRVGCHAGVRRNEGITGLGSACGRRRLPRSRRGRRTRCLAAAPVPGTCRG